MRNLRTASLKLNVFLNAGAGAWNKISGAVIRLAQVPLLLSALGVDDYGRWLVLSGFPTLIMLASFGFGSVAATEMSMLVASGNLKSAKKVFSTTIALVWGIGILGSLLISIIAPFIPWETFLDLPPQQHNEITVAVIWMSIATFISFSTEALIGRYIAGKKAHLGVLVNSFSPFISLIALIICLRFSTRFDHIALSILFSTVIFYFIYLLFSWKVMPEISFSVKKIQPELFKFLFKKGVAFQAFPLGHALLIPGILMIVQTILGPAAVAVFGTARTLVRTVNQVMEVINQAVGPELSHIFGSGDLAKAAKLHRAAVAVSFVLSMTGVVFLGLAGPALYQFWVGKSITLSRELLIVFLLPIPFTALWFTSSVVHMASNKHEALALRYLIAASLACIVCAFLAHYYGIKGAALSTLVVDILLVPFVLKRSLVLVNDRWSDFFTGIISQIKFVIMNLRSYLPFLKN